jgi:hypothetical protein
MKEEKDKIEFQFPPGFDPARDKCDPELEKFLKEVAVKRKHLERANEVLEKFPVPQWIMDL